jgi:hypothetical protein
MMFPFFFHHSKTDGVYEKKYCPHPIKKKRNLSSLHPAVRSLDEKEKGH